MSTERIRLEIEAFCARVHAEMSTDGGRIHVITLNPDIELRAGPYLELTARDLAAMSMPELEAYLDAMLRLDDGNDMGAAASNTYGPFINRLDHMMSRISGVGMSRPA